MKVLLVTENLGSGGAERQLTQLACLLKEAGHAPIVVTWLDRNFFEDILRQYNVRHILLQPRGRFDRVRKLAALLRIERPQAVISYLPMANETAVLARLLCPGQKMRLIVSERSFTTDWGTRRMITNLLYRVADYVIANSNNEAENIRQHCPSLAKKTFAIPNALDIKKFGESKRQRSFSQPIQLIGVGRIIPSKNIERLIEALAEVRRSGFDFRFKWYGAKSDLVCVESVKRTIIMYDLADCFQLEDATNNIYQVYAEADAFVFPSLVEGYPNVLVEAMASGLPIAVSAVCEHPYIITEGENGFLFAPKDVHSMAKAICKLCSLSIEDAITMGNNNRGRVIANNSADVFLLKYLSYMQ